VYYPTGVRNYVRLKPGDDLQGAAHAVFADQLGLESAYVLHDGSEVWRALLIEPFRRAAGRLGIRIEPASLPDALLELLRGEPPVEPVRAQQADRVLPFPVRYEERVHLTRDGSSPW
jgi:hypothetical protein